ncbi:MAG: ABC transporter permease [Ardenticatenaceae bacterium]
MSIFFRIRGIFILTFKRLWSQRGLTVATAVGLITAVALIMTVPLYADAVYYRVLQSELSESTERSNRPPFAYMYNYIGAWHGSVQWEDVEAVSEYLSGAGHRRLGLDRQLMVRHFETDKYKLFPADVSNYADEESTLAFINFAFTSDIEAQINIVEGAFPTPAESSPDSTIEVLVTEAFADELGLQVGESYIAFNHRDRNSGTQQEMTVRIAGVWQPKEPDDPFWFYSPGVFDDLLLVPEATFVNRLSRYLSDEVYLGLWYLVMDGSRVDTNDVEQLVAGASVVERRLDTLLTGTSGLLSPLKALQSYRSSSGVLAVLLFAFNVPTVGLVLAFIGLVVGLSVNQRRNEIAVMRSRGATAGQIVGIAVLDGLLLGVFSFLIGSGVALMLTQLMGKTRSFLDFSLASELRVAVTTSALYAGAIAIGLALLAQVLPTITASRHTIITYKEERARSLTRPWWQRAWLDLLLLAVAGYGFYQLRTQGSLLLPLSAGSSTPGDPFQNPLLFLLPALTIFAITLFLLRLLPLVMSTLSWLLARTDSVSLLMATRHLARTPRFYATPFILLVLTVSLSVFTASLAKTVDSHLFAQMFYKIGTSMNMTIFGNTLDDSGGFGGFGGAQQEDEAALQSYVFLPISEYEAIPNVQAATRVGRYRATGRVSNGQQRGNFIGIDRVDFGRAAYWRRDFAPSRLGSLLNALATTPEGVLVPRTFMQQRALRVGDFIRIDVRVFGGNIQLNAQIVGSFDYFPTWYPEKDGVLFVGNLDHLFEQAGGEFPYQVWLKTPPNLDEEQFKKDLVARNLFSTIWDEPYSGIQEEQIRPERQGLFGLLSVGFGTAAFLTVLGFFLYALFSFRRRFIELGILRAVGLSARQMIVFVACELAFLIVSGLTLGTALGTWVSQLFIPYLQIGRKEAELVPPYLVEIPWPTIFGVYALFALLFVVALGVLAALLLRMKIFQAVKLGETA